MPTLNEYQDQNGYYIRARPSSAEGPITYQVKQVGETILESYGLSHQDKISWDIITILKSIQAIYTEQSGVIEPDEFDPDPDALDETALDEAKAFELLAIIREHHDLTPQQVCDIYATLDIDKPPVSEIGLTIPITPETMTKVEQGDDIVADWGRDEHTLFWRIIEVLETTQEAVDNSPKLDFALGNEGRGFLAGRLVTELTGAGDD